MSSWPWIGLGLQMPYKCPYKWPANGMQMAIHTTPLYPLSICRVLGPDGPPRANSPLAARGSKIDGAVPGVVGGGCRLLRRGTNNNKPPMEPLRHRAEL